MDSVNNVNNVNNDRSASTGISRKVGSPAMTAKHQVQIFMTFRHGFSYSNAFSVAILYKSPWMSGLFSGKVLAKRSHDQRLGSALS